MIAADPVATLLSLPDEAAQRRFLGDYIAAADSTALDELAERLKDRVIQLQQVDIQVALCTVCLLQRLADRTGNLRYRALALRSEAQARLIGLGEFKPSLALYDKAIQIYRSLGDAEGEAITEVTHIWALASLGRYDEALAAGHRAAEVLRHNGRWLIHATLHNNLAAIYSRMGHDEESLVMLETALEAYGRLGEPGAPFLSNTTLNRGIALRFLGRYSEAIAATETALSIAERFGQNAMVARTKQNLGITYFVQGRFNEALQLLHEARDIFSADGRRRDTILVELFLSDCLLQLRRFTEVLEKCQQVRALFTERGIRFEVAQSRLNEAMAHIGLEQYDEARLALDEARSMFVAEGNSAWTALTDLKRATVLLQQGVYPAAYETALACAADFQSRHLPLEASQAYLVAGQAAAALGRRAEAQQLAALALAFGEQEDIPLLTYQVHLLLGRLAREQEETTTALAEFDAAIRELERLQGHLMVEYRSTFVEDKQRAYEDALSICLELKQPECALEYAERARARALLDLLAHRLNLGLQARSAADAPLVEQLVALRAERDRLYRRWESVKEHSTGNDLLADGRRVQEDVLVIEKKITGLWHKLLVRNADYARDAALWQVHTEPVQPYLDGDTALLAYFFVHERLVAFVITAEQVASYELPTTMTEVAGWLQRYGLNLRAVGYSGLGQREALLQNAQAVLHKLYTLLLQPFEATLRAFNNLIVVPHGPLHYLPFHALYDGRSYLAERHNLSYLPAASFLRHVSGVKRPSIGGTFFAGHSWGGRLPYTVTEAQTLAQLWGGTAIVEDEVTLERVRGIASESSLIHLATHGDFRPDNPLFSGLSLADGWLTTLDVFDLRLQASLVTLSACQTGRSVVAGGDELFGLMRAFLQAGARSLLLSLWPVADETTAALMTTFYQKLAAGERKGQALHEAQCSFIHGDNAYRHPYFWAPFYLVGDAGVL